MKVCVLVFVAVVCALLPSDGAASDPRSGLSALAKRSVSVFARPHSVNIDRSEWRTAFDKLYAELTAIDEGEGGDDEHFMQLIDQFLDSNDVDEFLEYLGVPMETIDGRLNEKYPDLSEDEHKIVKALALLYLTGYDIEKFTQDSSSVEAGV